VPVTQVPSTCTALKVPAHGLCAPDARPHRPAQPACRRGLVALVSHAEAAREQLDEREYQALIDLAGRWLDAERDRLAQRPRLDSCGE
jgi:hypothetical protein